MAGIAAGTALCSTGGDEDGNAVSTDRPEDKEA